MQKLESVHSLIEKLGALGGPDVHIAYRMEYRMGRSGVGALRAVVI